MLTDNEKRYYNVYLHTSRSYQNKPFRARRDFSKMKDEDVVQLKRIGNMLRKFPHVQPIMYFKAPFEIYEDEKYFDLKFFASQKGLKAYTTYMKKMENASPDHPDQINFIKDSLKFIAQFCMRQNITLDEYVTHKSGVTYSWMKHFKERKISLYSLFEFSKLGDIIMSEPEDTRELFLGEIPNKLFNYKTQYHTSKEAKKVVTEGIKRIKKYVEETTNHSNIKT